MHPGEDVEFLADGGGACQADEDIVEFGTRRVPRWAVVLACALAALGVVGVLASRPRTKQSAAADVPTTRAMPVGHLGAALRFDGGPPDALDALVDGDRLYVLRSTQITVVAPPAKQVVDSVWLTGDYAVAHQSSARLLLDAAAGRLWVIEQGVRPARVLEFDAATLRPRRHMTVGLAVHDAAAMNGYLYLASSAGLAELAPGALATAWLPTVHGSVSAVEADPARRRIVVLDDSSPVAVSVMSAGEVTARRIFGRLNSGSIAIIGDEIWIGGSGDYGAILARLDPATLAPLQTSPVALEAGGVAVSAGGRDVWVSTSGPGLWCLDARNGDILARWPTASGPVTSRAGAAYVVDERSVVPLPLNTCVG